MEAFPRGPLVPRNGPSCGEHGSRATDLSTKNHAGTFEAWSRHLAKSLMQRADNAVIENCPETCHSRSLLPPPKSSIISRKDNGDTPTYTIMEQVCMEHACPQKHYIYHVRLSHARPETPIYVLKLKTENDIEILIRHDRL
jgi:hypothetical protein